MERVIFPPLVLVFILCTLAGLGGCASGGGSGSLSDATAEASGKNEERGRGEGRTRTRNEGTASKSRDDSYEYEEYDLPEYESGGGRSESKVKARPHLVLWYSRSDLAGDTIEGFSDVFLMYSGAPDTLSRYRGQLGMYYGRGRLGSRQDIQDGISDISEAGLEFGARRYFTRPGQPVGFYFSAGLQIGGMWWSYADSFESPLEDGGMETVSGDGVLYGSPYVGIGSSFLQTQKIEIGVNATVGFRWISNRTLKNFDNDLFRDVGEYRLNIEASFFF